MSVEKHTEKTFDPEKAKNDPGFYKFLASTSEGKAQSLDMSDTEALGRHFEVYEQQKPLAEKIVRVWETTVFAETKDSRLKISKDRRDALRGEVMNLAAENPTEFLELAKQVEQLAEFPKESAQILADISELAPELDLSDPRRIKERHDETIAELKEKRALLAKATTTGLFRWQKWDAKAAEAVEREYGIKREDVNEALRALEKELDGFSGASTDIAALAQTAEAREQSLDGLKTALMEKVPGLQAVHDELAKQVADKVLGLATSEKRADKQKAYEQFALHEGLAAGGRDYLGGIADVAAEKEKLDKELGEKVSGEIEKILAGHMLTGAVFKDLHNKLKPYLNLKTLGSRGKKECREILLSELEAFKDGKKPLAGPESSARRLVIEALYAELKTKFTP